MDSLFKTGLKKEENIQSVASAGNNARVEVQVTGLPPINLADVKKKTEIKKENAESRIYRHGEEQQF